MTARTKTEPVPQRKSQEQNSAVKRLIPIIILAVLVAVAVFVYLWGLRVKKVAVNNVERYTEEKIAECASIGVGDFLYAGEDAEIEESIKAACPYVERVTVERIFPDTVVLTVQETSAAFYTEVFGEGWALDRNLQVLDKMTQEEANLLSLTTLVLPEIRSVVAGTSLALQDEQKLEKIDQIAENILSSSLGAENRIEKAYCEDLSECVLICDNRYRMIMGDVTDFGMKLKIADKVLEDSMFATGSKALIDLSKTSQTSVILDPDVDVT